ncbi:Kinesin, motor domain-containing protein [Artemisia annua]|uniref:Kinesin, motor domain-containing protein n=1 Tax=Artemisia annua TaxID=35608 RepID=A0A2U1N3K0_ARTAN|nr:Kinesin, motor domain-containing protein [Artemisia annua]
MVSLALRQIFSEKGHNGSKSSRTFYLSMFEYIQRKGKEKGLWIDDQTGAVIHDVQQAESFIASGMLKRSTAMTNSNLQSSFILTS